METVSLVNRVLATRNWGAAWTRSRQEKALVRCLDALQVASFLPTIAVRHVYGASKIRTYSRPLFSGYVFYDADAIAPTRLYETRRVAQILCPPDQEKLRSELANLALALSADCGLRVARVGRIGQRVRIKCGQMQGLCGELLRYRAESRLIIRISFLSRAAELSIDEAFVEPL